MCMNQYTKIGEIIEISSGNVRCINCSHSTPYTGGTGRYMGHHQAGDMIDVHNPATCQNCGTVLRWAVRPCEGIATAAATATTDLSEWVDAIEAQVTRERVKVTK